MPESGDVTEDGEVDRSPGRPGCRGPAGTDERSGSVDTRTVDDRDGKVETGDVRRTRGPESRGGLFTPIIKGRSSPTVFLIFDAP